MGLLSLKHLMIFEWVKFSHQASNVGVSISEFVIPNRNPAAIKIVMTL